MKKWRCTICGFIYTGENPPESCPSCGAPQEAFEPFGKPIPKPKSGTDPVPNNEL